MFLRRARARPLAPPAQARLQIAATSRPRLLHSSGTGALSHAYRHRQYQYQYQQYQQQHHHHQQQQRWGPRVSTSTPVRTFFGNFGKGGDDDGPGSGPKGPNDLGGLGGLGGGAGGSGGAGGGDGGGQDDGGGGGGSGGEGVSNPLDMFSFVSRSVTGQRDESPEEFVDAQYVSDVLLEALSNLSQRQAQIICMRYGLRARRWGRMPARQAPAVFLFRTFPNVLGLGY